VDLFTDVIKHDYLHDVRGRRTSDVQLDGTVWAHEYNSRGEVIGSARRDTLGGNAGPGRDFGYFYDDIGNRITSLENQFDNGNPNVPATLSDITTYGSNLANQFTQKVNPDPAKSWVLGSTTTGTVALSVTHVKNTTNTPVVTAPLDRYGVGDKDFAAEINFGVTNAPAYRQIKVKVGTAAATTWGELYLPPANEVPTYDAAGNLTADSRWLYTWDAENRLTRMETTAAAVTAMVPKQRLEFTYDSENRRVRKVRKGWVSNAWVVQADLRFVYDGWNLVAELEPVVVTSATSLPAYVRTYTWGKDVTGTEQGAGGVGGLLFVGRYTKDTGTNVLASTLAPMYDGNSNIEGYVKLLVPTANTSAAATTAFKLEYDPFGRELMIEATSPETQATLPPFRFSTKYTDSETDLVYYGHRYYSPELGRWISRDPIEEAGGLNLYGMVGNDPVNSVDLLGLVDYESSDVAMFAAADGAGRSAIMAEYHKYRAAKEAGKPYQPVEHGGRVCEEEDTCGNKIYWTTRRVEDASSGSRQVAIHMSPPCPSGSKQVGFWHSHPGSVQNSLRPGEFPFSPGGELSGTKNDPRFRQRGDTDVSDRSGVPVMMTRRLGNGSFETTGYFNNKFYLYDP